MKNGDTLRFYRDRYVSPFLFFLLSLLIILTAVKLSFGIPVKSDLTYPEGSIVVRAFDVVEGTVPYHDWKEWPHSFAPYGPLAYYPVGWAARVLFDDVHPGVVYRVGRIQSLLGVLGIGVLIAVFAGRFGGGRLGSLLGVAFFASWFALLSFASSFRPDAPQAFFSLAALAVAIGGPSKPRRLSLALLFLSLSMWLKPTSWGVAAALGFWIWTSSGWRTLLVSLGLFCAVNLTCASLLNRAWDGLLFLNMINPDNSWEPGNLLRFYGAMPLVPGIVFCGAVAGSAFSLVRTRLGDGSKVFIVALAGTFIFSTLQNQKRGADINYFLECYALTCAAAAWWFTRLWQVRLKFPAKAPEKTQEWMNYLLATPLLLISSVGALASARQDLTEITRAWATPESAQRIETVQGPVLVPVPYLALQRPAPPTIMDYVQYSVLVEDGRIEERYLIERIEGGMFDVVAIPSIDFRTARPSWYSPTVLHSLRNNYEETGVLDGLSILEFRGRTLRPSDSPP